MKKGTKEHADMLKAEGLLSEDGYNKYIKAISGESELNVKSN